MTNDTQETEDTSTAPQNDNAEAPKEAADFAFLDGVDGVTINEAVLVFVADGNTKIGGVTFRPREGITGLNLQSDLSKAIVAQVTLTFDADEHFPGVTVDGNPDNLLLFHDREFRDAVVADCRARWFVQQQEAAEAAQKAAAETPDAAGTESDAPAA